MRDSHSRDGKSPGGLWRRRSVKTAAGPLITLAVAFALFLLDSAGARIPNPVLFFANCIVFSGFFGGMGSGLASVAVTLCFTLIYWSLPGQLFHYTDQDVNRLIVLAVTMPPLGLLVGWLRGAYDAKSRDLERQNAQLVAELRRRSALEEKQRDIEHIIRHDLRAPLSGVISVPELLMEDANITLEQKELLTMVSTAGRKMLKQINNSLELRKIEDGVYEPEATPCDPAEILQGNIDMLSLGEPGAEKIFHFEAGPRMTLVTDGMLLDVILSNLLKNAAEACDCGCPVLVTLCEEEDHCVISIANNRPVPEEVRECFFEKYATAGKPGGTGLGTYSAAIMTRAIGGDIFMETSPETGARVTLRIPLALPARAA